MKHLSETTPGRPRVAPVLFRAIRILQADHLRLEEIVLKNGGWRCDHCEAVQAPGDTRYRREDDYLCCECFREIQHAAQRRRNTACS
ncbi:MAG TPA: hypothetical protein PLO37_06430 [Candidatus Hydrogenedentes bacterium]|nr:hypothetical protein [Candidatus Hydrogenedentota bacterium]HPG66467.1 hypothetical protein [Candidatus Hydrogenedentota bacterium]